MILLYFYGFCVFFFYCVCELTERQQDEQESATTATGHVQVTLVDGSTKLQGTTNTSSSKVRN